MRRVFTIVTLALAMVGAAALPAHAPWDAPRVCDNWYAGSGNIYRLSHCSSPYFVQDVVKASADLHLYVNGSTPSSTGFLAIDNWRLIVAGQSHTRSTQVKSGEAVWSFYSAGIGVGCTTNVQSQNIDESFGRNGAIVLGPGGASEVATSATWQRCDAP